MKLCSDNHQLNRALDAVTAQRLRWLDTGDPFDRLRLDARQKHIECSWYPHSVLGTCAADVARQLYLHTNTVPLPSEVHKTMEHIRHKWTNKRATLANRMQTLTQSLPTLTTELEKAHLCQQVLNLSESISSVDAEYLAALKQPTLQAA